MKLTEFLKPEFCVMDLKSGNKEAAIRELVSVLEASGKIRDKEDFIRHIMERERLGSTGIGKKVAIPHAPTQSVEGLVVAFGRSINGIDFQALDGNEVNLIFLLGTNPGELGTYLKFLATLSKLLNNRQFRQDFLSAQTPKSVIEVLSKYEKAEF
jgi:fructose-specific phosphotransferase system IIA component